MLPTKGTSPIKSFIKQKMMDKVDRPSRKPKVVITPIVGKTPLSTKLPPSPRHGNGKGLMTTKGPAVEQHPPPLRGLTICHWATLVHH